MFQVAIKVMAKTFSKDKTELASEAVVKARQTDTYRYKLVWKVTTSSDLRVCVCRHVSPRIKKTNKKKTTKVYHYIAVAS